MPINGRIPKFRSCFGLSQIRNSATGL